MSVTYGNNKSRFGLSGPQGAAGPANRKPSTNRLWHLLATRSGAIQPKLTVSQVNDPQEREADRIANGIMQMPPAGKSLHSNATESHVRLKSDGGESEQGAPLQLQQGASEDSATGAPPVVHETLNLPGQPLDQGTRSFMEDRFSSGFD